MVDRDNRGADLRCHRGFEDRNLNRFAATAEQAREQQGNNGRRDHKLEPESHAELAKFPPNGAPLDLVADRHESEWHKRRSEAAQKAGEPGRIMHGDQQ